MNDLGKGLLAIVSGIIVVAIVSVFVAPRSSAPRGIAAAGGALANVIHAAVSPVTTAATNGAPNLNAFTMPAPGMSASGGFSTLHNITSLINSGA